MSRLDVGGKTLRFDDREGEREFFVELANAIIESVPAAERPATIDPGALVDASGLAQSSAAGSSIRQDGDSWLQRSYSYLPNGRQGLASLLGAEPVKFLSPGLIPAATDLVLEAQLDTTTLPALLQRIGKACGQEASIGNFLREPLPIGDNAEGVLLKTKLHLILGIDISSWQATPTSPQAVDFFVRIDGGKALLEMLLPQLEKGLGKPKAVGNRRGWEIPLPEELKQPRGLLLFDDSGTVTLASREAYLTYVDTAAMKLGEWKEYKAATNHFPESGNFLFYASPQVPAALGWAISRSAEKIDQESAPVIKKASGYLQPKPWSLCVACEPDGIVTMAEMPVLLKMDGPLPILAGTSVLFVGARAWKKGSDRAACIMNVRNVQQAVRSQENMSHLKPGAPIPWAKIAGPGALLSVMPTCAGGTYTLEKSVPKLGTLACKCSNPDHAPSNHDTW